MKTRLLCAAAILVTGVIIGFVGSRPRVAAPPVREIDEQLIRQRVEQVLKVITVEYHMSDIIDVSQEEPWFKKDKKALLISNAKIMAGFDLSKGFDVVIESSSNTNITIILPEPESITLQVC